jgi:hypothetical protein
MDPLSVLIYASLPILGMGLYFAWLKWREDHASPNHPAE